METNQPVQPVEQRTSTPTKKPLIRKSFIVGLYMFFSLVAIAILSLQIQEYKKQIVQLKSLPSPTPSYVYTNIPSPTPAPSQQPFATNRQTIDLQVQKYLDSTEEKEVYKISFDKLTTDSQYSISQDPLPKLVISGSTYQLTIQIPKEGFNQPISPVPVTHTIQTLHLGEITRVQRFVDPDSYAYTNDYSTKCSQREPTPPACSSDQVYFYPKSHPNQQVGAYITCFSANNYETCDKLVSGIDIDLK